MPPIQAADLTSSPVYVEFLLDILVLGPVASRARGFFASNSQALRFRSLSKTTCWGTYVLPPTHSSEDAEFVRDWGCDAGQGGYITRSMPLEPYSNAAAAYKLQYSRPLAERTR